MAVRADDRYRIWAIGMGDFKETLTFPMTIEAYMEVCNTYYYATRDPFGTQGDFTTAPEISQIFGECIGAFMAHIWMHTGRTPFDLIEGGPGRGTLMADLWRGTKSVTGFHEAAAITLVETSPLLKDKQCETLSNLPAKWVNSISEITLNKQNKYMIFNELFDALPVRQFIYTDHKWGERLVNHEPLSKTDEAGGLFFDKSLNAAMMPILHPQEGDIYEIAPARTGLMTDICRMLAHDGGVAVIIDYGTNQWGVGDTLQAMRGHQYVDILADAGEVDLTSHVDFIALMAVARSEKLYCHPLLTQGRFLDALGGRVRAEKLGQMAAYKRLADPDHMGELFKVLIVAHKDLGAVIKGVFG